MTAPPRVIIVVTGSECTGKTTLASDLATRFETAWSHEFAREYLDLKSAPLDDSDVAAIASGQMRTEDAVISGARRLVIKDTDLVSTVVYSRHYYGACPGWIEEAAYARRGDLYLLLHPDVPWLPDGLHRDQADRREFVHSLFSAELARMKVRIVEVRGNWDERRRCAIQAVLGRIAEIP